MKIIWLNLFYLRTKKVKNKRMAENYEEQIIDGIINTNTWDKLISLDHHWHQNFLRQTICLRLPFAQSFYTNCFAHDHHFRQPNSLKTNLLKAYQQSISTRISSNNYSSEIHIIFKSILDNSLFLRSHQKESTKRIQITDIIESGLISQLSTANLRPG